MGKLLLNKYKKKNAVQTDIVYKNKKEAALIAESAS
jgi:hypothetical protein